jgi:ribonuclease P protein component
MLQGSRRYRLAGAGVFEAIFRRGRRREGRYLQIVVAAAAGDWGRAGFVIGRKALPRAVDRNRVRRMLRRLLQSARPALARYDVIVRLKRGAPRADFPLIVAEAATLLAAVDPEGQAR